jgi:hypothetical protein
LLLLEAPLSTVIPLPVAADQAVFWAEMHRCEHVVQIYGDDRVFLDGLEGFIGNGLREGESAIVIATVAHLDGLEERLVKGGLDLARLRAENRYVPRVAEDVLAEFVVEGWPDERRFHQSMGELMRRARGDTNRKVRAFGEMVALLWSDGHADATIKLELLWGRLVERERFPVFCAYPRDAFARNATESIVEICQLHSRVA